MKERINEYQIQACLRLMLQSFLNIGQSSALRRAATGPIVVLSNYNLSHFSTAFFRAGNGLQAAAQTSQIIV